MSANSSSSSHDCIHLPDLFSLSSSALGTYCFTIRPSSLVFVSFNITNILLLLPLCSFILYLGLQRWRQQRSSTAATTISHSDSFAYHMVAMELVGVFGSSLSCCGVYNGDITVSLFGTLFLTVAWFGQTFFHILTCLERYLAVFHPITYLSLKKQRGIRIRNITNGCVWLLSFTVTLVFMLDNTTVDFCLLVLSFVIIVFCSLSVLCALTRPGPGEQGGDRGRVDQSKQRAFYTIVVILGMLSVRCTWNLVWILLHFFRGSCECLMMMCDYWFNLPCSLVLPVLFLHRSGKLACWQKNNQ